MPAVVDVAQLRAAGTLRALIAAYEAKRELIALGAYEAGSDALVDRAAGALPAIESFLRQAPGERSTFDSTTSQLLALAKRFSA